MPLNTAVEHNDSLFPNPTKGHIMRTTFITLPLAASFLLSACTTNDLGDSRDLTKTQTGAIIGTVSGAALGASSITRTAARAR
jgi:hypothetical protein